MVKKNKKVKAKAKPICTHCNGDGVFHTPKTGYRLSTMADNEVKVDESRSCPVCK